MGNYAANLLHAMTALRPEIEIILLTDEVAAGCTELDGHPVRRVGPMLGYRWHLWERVGLPWHAWRLGAELIHSPANTTSPRAPMPRVVTVHDVIPYLPEVSASGGVPKSRYLRRTIPRAVRQAAAVVTDSEASRSDIARVFEMPPDRIHVVPLAVGADVQSPTEDLLSWLEAEGIRQPYLLALAANAPRKNTAGVLQVFQRVSKSRPELQLVLTGVGPTLRPRIEGLLRELGIPPSRVRLLPFVTAEQRNRLYGSATVFLFLSLYEGFGLPILEAMRCGAPVLCSNRSSCPEVAGEAGTLVDPTDEDAIAERLLAMLDATASERDRWRQLGQERERQFTWSRTAEMTLNVYDLVTS
jgi:glycosyltransferase involved in cell wall biosynthesis